MLKLSTPTKICKICFNSIRDNSLFDLIKNNELLCENCRKLFKSRFIHFEVDGYKALAIYDYDETIKTYLYQFKGCYDYELYPIFLNHYAFELKIKYLGYILVPAPSYIKDDEKRGFKHVIEMFKILDLPILEVFEKTDPFKQAENSAKKRKDIVKILKVKENIILQGKKVLIIDDVFTTGATVRGMIHHLKKLHPKDIKILVMSKTTLKPI